MDYNKISTKIMFRLVQHFFRIFFFGWWTILKKCSKLLFGAVSWCLKIYQYRWNFFYALKFHFELRRILEDRCISTFRSGNALPLFIQVSKICTYFFTSIVMCDGLKEKKTFTAHNEPFATLVDTHRHS